MSLIFGSLFHLKHHGNPTRYYTRSVDENRVGDAVLGAFTVFTRRILYDVFDVTDILTSAAEEQGNIMDKRNINHSLAITLGNGWYSQPTVALGPRMVKLYMSVDYTVSSEIDTPQTQHADEDTFGLLTIVSNSSWMLANGPTVIADIYLGATHDARKETIGWELPNYTTTSDKDRWIAAVTLPSPLLNNVGVLRAQLMPRIRQCQRFTPQSVRWFSASSKLPAGWVVDFGQNMAGTVELTIPSSVLRTLKSGSNITVRHAEMVYSNGSLHHLYGSKVAEISTYIIANPADFGREPIDIVYEPHFTYMGFRYIHISISAFENIGTISPLPVSVVAHFVHSDLEHTGSITTSSGILNKIIHAAIYSQLATWTSLPTDCTQVSTIYIHTFGYCINPSL